MKAFIEIYRHATNMHAEGKDKVTILTYLAIEAAKLSGKDTAVSILKLDEHGFLRNAASPTLPKDYLAAIDGIKPDPQVGTCAAAAATGNMIYTADFRSDNKWAELKHLPLSIGYVGAWSMPIKAEDGKVLGTFGTYFKKVYVPTMTEKEGIEMLAKAAAIVLAA